MENFISVKWIRKFDVKNVFGTTLFRGVKFVESAEHGVCSLWEQIYNDNSASRSRNITGKIWLHVSNKCDGEKKLDHKLSNHTIFGYSEKDSE